jgi:hypothetical protein
MGTENRLEDSICSSRYSAQFELVGMTLHNLNPQRRLSLGAGVLVLVLVLLGVGGCQRMPEREIVAPERLPPPAPLATVGATHYRVNSNLSDVRILVYRGGPLAKFGHNHIIRAGAVTGDVYLNVAFERSGFVLSLPVEDFQVDPPAMRHAEGEDFALQPSAEAVAATTENMLGPEVLDAAHYPVIHLRSVNLVGPEWGPDITVSTEIHGVRRRQTVTVALEQCDDKLIATGSFTIRQSDFGITPFSVLGGGLQVQDPVKLRFRIVAERVE